MSASERTAPPRAFEVGPRTRRRALIAASIGNVVEWYDFALYGAFATSIAITFFPQRDPRGGGLVATYLIFVMAFLARPAGALVFGHIGDRLGRRRALTTGILMMSLVTAGAGLLPGYAAIGPAAPALLALLRLGQGVAIGGEYGGSATFVVEYAPDGRRGWYGGWQWATISLGFAAGLGTAALLGAVLSTSALHGWGWRVAFLLTLPLGAVGLYIRTRLEDTPDFLALQHAEAVATVPLSETLRTARRQVVIGFGVVTAVVVTFNLFFVFLPTYVASAGGDLSDAFGAALVGLIVGCGAAPVVGRLSDVTGRRSPLLVGTLSLVVVTVPAAVLVATGDAVRMVIGYAVIGLVLGGLAPTAFLAELFPTRLRYSGLSLTYGVASAVFGSTAPLFAAVIARQTGTPHLAAWYATAASALAVACVLSAPETAHLSSDAGTGQRSIGQRSPPR